MLRSEGSSTQCCIHVRQIINVKVIIDSIIRFSSTSISKSESPARRRCSKAKSITSSSLDSSSERSSLLPSNSMSESLFSPIESSTCQGSCATSTAATDFSTRIMKWMGALLLSATRVELLVFSSNIKPLPLCHGLPQTT